MPDSRAAQQLWDRSEIIALANAYAEALDTKVFEKLRDIFAEDVQALFGDYQCNGVEEFLQMVESHLAGCGPTQHLFSNHRVSVDGDRAQTRFYASTMHAGVGEKSEVFLQIWSEYKGELVRTAQGWRLCRYDQRIIKTRGDFSILKGPAEQA